MFTVEVRVSCNNIHVHVAGGNEADNDLWHVVYAVSVERKDESVAVAAAAAAAAAAADATFSNVLPRRRAGRNGRRRRRLL